MIGPDLNSRKKHLFKPKYKFCNKADYMNIFWSMELTYLAYRVGSVVLQKKSNVFVLCTQSNVYFWFFLTGT